MRRRHTAAPGTPAAGTAAEEDGPRPRLTGRVLLTVLGLSLAYSVTAVDPLMLTLNLSRVGLGLDVPPNLIGFLGGAATLVVAAAVLAVGNLGDVHGLKRLLMLGLVGNAVAGVLCALSPNHVFLLVMRFLDGLALTALLGLSLALLTVSVPQRVRPLAIGIFMAVDTVLYGVSPLVGGWVVDAVGWRGTFLVTPPLALAALVLTFKYVKESPLRPGRRVDVLGVTLFGAALLGAVHGTGELQNGLARPQAWLPLAGAALALAAFVRHERRTPEPALDTALFRSPALVVAVLAVLTLDFLSAGLGVVLGQFGGAVLALTPEQIGLLYLPGTLVIAGASVLAGRAVASRTARPVMIAGLLMLVASTLVLAGTVSPTMALWLLVLATWTCNLGAFVTSTPVSDTVLAHAPQGKAGSVAAVQPTFGMTGYALGPTVYILLLDLFFRKEWLADAESRGLSAEQGEQAVDAAMSSMANAPGSPGYDPNLVRQASELALGLDFTNAVRLTMLTVALAPLAVVVLAYFLMPRRPRHAPDTGREAGPDTGREATPGTTPGDEPGPGPGPGGA
ncbi:MFS transporter [Streptomyces sp. NPDC059637]|uniref:MFS transporter n=1 Tax=Streptomyces sp. NPDC059637 TaxID=3347752 RepID=UPI003690FD5B